MKRIAEYVHVPAPGSPLLDTRLGAYYVSVQDGKRTALLAGPWPTHREALDMVDTVRALAQSLDPRGAFYAFGTARLPDDDSVPLRYGSLNAQLGLPYR